MFFLFICNILTYTIHYRYTRTDATFKHWLRHHQSSATIIPLSSLLINFKLIRLFNCNFMNLPYLNAQFTDPMMFYKPQIVYMTVISIVLYMLPLIIVDIIAFFYIDWGFQLLVNWIESFILTLLIVWLCLIEAKRLKKKLGVEDELQIKDYYVKQGGMDVQAYSVQIEDPDVTGRMMIDSDDKRRQLKALINTLKEEPKVNLIARSESYKDFREFDEGWAPDKRQLRLEKCISYP